VIGRREVSDYPIPARAREEIMSLEAVRGVWDRLRANQLKLDSCARHAFTLDLAPDKELAKRWGCAQCGGVVDAAAKTWYEAGARHAAVPAS
jgi:hypothetical protein